MEGFTMWEVVREIFGAGALIVLLGATSVLILSL